MSRYQETLAAKVPGVGKRWDEEWKPVVIAKNEPAKTADYASLSDAEMVAKLEEFVEHMTYQWWIHGHINFVLLSSSAFCDMYDAEMQPEEKTEAYQTLQGFHTRSVDVSRAMWKLSRDVKKSPTLAKLFADKSSSEIVGELDKTDDGRAFHAKLRDVPRGVRVAQRRGVRPRRHPMARGRVGGAVEHRRLRRPRRQRGSRAAVPEGGEAARGAAREGEGEARQRSREARQVRRAVRGSPLQLPRHRGSRVLHRPARASACSAGSRSPSATASCRRASSTRPTTCSSSVAPRCPKPC